MNSEEFIDHLNSQNLPWTAGKNNKFENMTFGELKSMLGVNMTETLEIKESFPIKPIVEVPADLPESYDPREKYPNCPSIAEIGDQAMCGSCWAVAAATSLSDRSCIAGGDSSYRTSIDNLMSCVFAGCNGG